LTIKNLTTAREARGVRRPILLWVDLRVQKSSVDFYVDLSATCDIHTIRSASAVSRAIRRFGPDALCFDYDYPDLTGLRVLRQTKLDHRSLPIIMLIEQSSPALTIWAFRTGVRDYVVKPVDAQTLHSQMEVLIKIPKAQSDAESRENYLVAPPIPLQARIGHSNVQAGTLPAPAYVDIHFHERISLEEVARHCRMGIFQFSRAFKREHGLTFQEFLVRHRIAQARHLLKNPRLSISECAFAVGFSDPSYFARLFKRYEGVSPSEYRMKLLG
jgi:YesN/AraC family two-component response regulator